jgi:hypothetical protein
MMNESEPLMRHLEGITRRKGLIRRGRREVALVYWERERTCTGLKGEGLHTQHLSLQHSQVRQCQGVEMASKGIHNQATTVNLGTPFIGLTRLGRSTDEVNGGRRPRNSRWELRPTYRAWESHAQGEGGQLHRRRGQATLVSISREIL